MQVPDAGSNALHLVAYSGNAEAACQLLRCYVSATHTILIRLYLPTVLLRRDACMVLKKIKLCRLACRPSIKLHCRLVLHVDAACRARPKLTSCHGLCRLSGRTQACRIPACAVIIQVRELQEAFRVLGDYNLGTFSVESRYR